MAQRRGVTPIIAKLRDWLLGHKLDSPHRYEGAYSKRTQPPPNIPPGVSSKLSGNYYYTRDGRNEVLPPEIIYTPSPAVTAGETKEAVKMLPPIPGFGYNWSTGKSEFVAK